MPTEITKEEINALIETHTKTALQLQTIANTLSILVSSCDKIVEKLNNGITKDMKECISKETKILRDAQIDIKSDTFWLKIIFGSITFISAIAYIVSLLLMNVTPKG